MQVLMLITYRLGDHSSHYFLAVGLVNDPNKKILSQHKVRTNVKERTLDSMFPVTNPAHVEASSDPIEPSQGQAPQREIKESECYLASVKSLRQAVLKKKHKGSGASFYSCHPANFSLPQAYRKYWRCTLSLALSTLTAVFLSFNTPLNSTLSIMQLSRAS
jgi:rRNA maturation protein Nop10